MSALNAITGEVAGTRFLYLDHGYNLTPVTLIRRADGMTYQQAHPLYRRLGWPGVLPLASVHEGAPAGGVHRVGRGGPVRGGLSDFDELPAYRGTAQTALRMPSTVIGVDVDAYGDKTGAATLAEAEQRWGPLPPGPWSSARDDGVSGIRFFRVPDGTVLVSDIAFREMHLGHIEVIQRHHRYAVVWPRVHPTPARRYTWRGADGPERPPAVGELPPLPRAWLAGLAGTGRTRRAGLPRAGRDFLAEAPRRSRPARRCPNRAAGRRRRPPLAGARPGTTTPARPCCGFCGSANTVIRAWRRRSTRCRWCSSAPSPPTGRAPRRPRRPSSTGCGRGGTGSG